MNDHTNSSAINPATLAAKLAAVANRQAPAAAAELEQTPRLVEALWFIQWRAMQPGGLALFVEEMIEAFLENFVTAGMRTIGKPRGNFYTVPALVEVWKSFPRHQFEDWGPANARRDLATLLHQDGLMVQTELKRAGMDRQLVEWFTPDIFGSRCQQAAEEALADDLRHVCLNPDSTFTRRARAGSYSGVPAFWYVQELPSMLFAMMDRHAEKTLNRIARTAVAEVVWREIRFAIASKGLVTIEGATRFGKTESVKAWTDAYPGRMRYFSVPPPGRVDELHRAVAGAFGLPYTARTTTEEIKDGVNYILEFGRIGVAADEAHHMVPVRRGQPKRLDWFRAQIVDKGTPCILSITEQFETGLAEFERLTGYNAAQWRGRVKRRVTLKDRLEDADLLAVARKHLPGFSDALLLRIAGRAQTSAHFLASMQNVAQRARFLADEDGRAEMTADDVKQALDDCLPSQLGAVPSEAAKHPRAVRGNVATTPPALTNLPPNRSVTPAIEADPAHAD